MNEMKNHFEKKLDFQNDKRKCVKFDHYSSSDDDDDDYDDYDDDDD